MTSISEENDIVEMARRFAEIHQHDLLTAMVLRQSALEIERQRRRAEKAEMRIGQLTNMSEEEDFSDCA